MVQAQLNTFPPHFRHPGRFPIDLAAPPPERTQVAPPPPVEIHDARPLQAKAASPAAFFDTHGFVLLKHKTAVQDWDTDVESVYAAEVAALIDEQLFPDRPHRVSVGPQLARRGRGTTNSYASGVHQDCGLTPDDYQQLVSAFASPQIGDGWRSYYDSDSVEGYMMLDFWRPTGMSEPLRHMPLTVCDPNSVEIDDLIPTEVLGVAPEGRAVHQMCLRRNPGQRWYYYPDMTMDEVLVFKLYESRKSDAEPKLRSAFHTAFADPTTPDDAEHRQSCEYRVGVWLLRE